jgi:transcriptional regulator with XRE-family HTH domain
MVGVDAVATDDWRSRIRHARERAGLSRKEAARRAGLSEGVWRNVETGIQHVAGVGSRSYRTTANTVARMAAAVRLDPLETVRSAGLDPDDVHVESIVADPASAGDVRVIVVRGNPSTDELLDEIRRLLGEPTQ